MPRYLGVLGRPRGLIGAILLVILVAAALVAPIVFPGGFDVQSRDSLRLADIQFPFGTDELGRDIFVRSLYGLRTDLTIVLVAVPLSMLIGTSLGLLGALWRPSGPIVQRILDIILGFPGIVLGVCIALIIGAGWWSLVIALTVSGIPFFGRQARSAVLDTQSREFVSAAHALGAKRGEVVWRHILPNSVDPIIAGGAVYVPIAVFEESGLSIIGLGIQPPEPSLGSLINTGMRFVQHEPMQVLGPTILIVILSLSFSLIADALNETANV